MALQQLSEGGTVYVQGSGAKPYAIRKIAGVVDCSCPAWRNMGGGIDTRICKHIKANIAPSCLPRAALSRAGMLGSAAPVLPAQPVAPAVRLTPKTGKVSTAVGGAVKKDTAPKILLAHPQPDGHDPTGYWISEKYDGVRAYWDGGKFISRLGNTFHAPYSFTKSLPTLTHLDGEIWGGRKTFQKVSGICRKHVADPAEWENLKFVVFDAPLANGRFEDRMNILNQVHADCSRRFPTEMSWEVVKQERCHSREHLDWVLADMDANNGEGLILREPGSFYVPDRSMTCLKVKTFYDAEGVVIGYQAGRGKHKGRVGALICRRLSDGVEFEVGTGLSDKERQTPPAVGVTITYSYKELTDAGKPRHASFISVRDYE